MSTRQEEEFNTALGRRLALLRQSRKMSQEYLGTALGVRSQQVHKYETGENQMPPKRIQICAKTFNVPVGYFYGESEDKNPSIYVDENISSIAVEISKLPESIRKNVYHLTKQINQTFSDQCKQEEEKHIA